jgi:hypothetical protein
MLSYMMVAGCLLLGGCREATPPSPADKPIEKPAAATVKPAASLKPATPVKPAAAAEKPATLGSAVADVITQRDKIEAGKRAKAVIEATAAKENKDLEEALQQ